jgi:tape measure domain-containing protein
MGAGVDLSSELTKLKEVAKLPGLGFKEAIEGSVRLQAAGFSADAARKTLMSFGNALATVGKGKASLDLVTLALTQMQNKTSGFGQDMRQLTEQLPQLRGALDKVFGTSETDKIAEMGYTGAQVVQMLTDEFAKLPKVTGGVGNALENLGDSLFVSSAKMGEAIDKAFNLQEKFDKLGETVSEFTDWFTSLDPAVQKVSFVFIGLVAAIGPLSLIVGQVISMLPKLAAGFTFLTGPVGLAVLAIAAAATAIIYYWDEISAYLKDSGIWDAVVSVWREGISVVVAYVKSFSSSIISIWNSIKGFVVPIVSGMWEIVTSIFRNVLTGLALVMRGFAKIFAGDWHGLSDIVKGIFGALWNSVIDIMTASIRTVGNLFAGLFESLGATDWATKIRGGIESVISTVKKAKVTFSEFSQAQSNLFQGDEINLGVGGNADTTNAGAGGGGLNPKKEKIQEQSDAFKEAKDAYLDAQKALEKYREEWRKIQSIGLLGGVNAITGKIESKDQRQNNTLGGLTIDPKVISGIQKTGIAQRQEEQKAFNEELQNTIDKLSIISPLTNAIGEQFTNLVTNGTFSFKAIGEALKQLITKLITAATTAAILAALTGGFSATAGGKGFAAIFKGILGFADGGVVTKPTLGMIGEAGQSEAVIPLPKLFSQMNNIFKAGQSNGNVGLQGITVVVNQDRFGNWNLNQQVETFRNRVG